MAAIGKPMRGHELALFERFAAEERAEEEAATERMTAEERAQEAARRGRAARAEERHRAVLEAATAKLPEAEAKISGALAKVDKARAEIADRRQRAELTDGIGRARRLVAAAERELEDASEDLALVLALPVLKARAERALKRKTEAKEKLRVATLELKEAEVALARLGA